MNRNALRLFIMAVHAASQRICYWLHPEKLLSTIIVDEFCLLELPLETDIYSLSKDYWRKVVVISARLLAKVYSAPRLQKIMLVRTDELAQNIYQHLKFCALRRAEVIVFGDDSYPLQLQAIPDPPLVLTVMGNKTLLQLPAVAIVGSRKASPRGLHESFLLGQTMASKGYAVVSGGAFGCDIAAHRGVLAASVSPVAAIIVFAGGFSHFHPQSNVSVFMEMLSRGALFITERLWHSVSRPMDFPIRNRIISGLCPTLIVMESGERSGAVLTARIALDQGRDVWVLQCAEDDIRALGSNKLIAEGAGSFLSAQEWQ